MLYQLNNKALQSISKDIFTPNQMASLADNVEGEAWERKVLKNFLEGDYLTNEHDIRLKDIPASRKKRLVILK